MKKIYNIIMLFAIALTGLSLTACGEEDLSTNQYGKGVSLNVYGPQPVMRGGTLRFLGSNLDQIAQVQIPGIDPITNIEVVQAGVPSEIRVVLPKDGPEPGYVTLVTKTDQKITTTTRLTYEEPIEITKFTPESAMPGETITIEGDYLNLVQMVEFADEVQVSQDDFVEHTRYAIKVVVPETARTGKLNLYTLDLTKEENNASDLTYNILETENALTVGTPTVTKFSSPRGEAEATGTVTVKAGETVTVTGTSFSLIDAVAFGGGDNVVKTTEFTVNEDGTSLTFALPADAPDGDVNLIARSGVEIAVGIINTVAPSECVAAPSPVKAGRSLTITGKDLDVVSSIIMPGVSDDVEFTAAGTTKLSVSAVPATATEGNITLKMKNGKTVEVPFTLVKPVVTGYDNNSVNAGGALVLKGTDLDLVKSVSFGGASVDVTPASDGKSITLTVPMEAVSGKTVMKLENGTTVDAPELSIKEAVFCYVVSFPDEENAPDAGGTLTVPVMNADKLTNVYVNGTEVKFVYDSKTGSLTIAIPEDATAESKLKLVSSNGQYETTFIVKPAGGKPETTIWEGTFNAGNWSGNQDLAWGGYDWSTVKAGQVLTLYFIQDTSSEYWQIALRHGNGWGNIGADKGCPDQVDLEAGATSWSLELNQAILDDLVANGGLVITGANYVLSKVTIK